MTIDRDLFRVGFTTIISNLIWIDLHNYGAIILDLFYVCSFWKNFLSNGDKVCVIFIRSPPLTTIHRKSLICDRNQSCCIVAVPVNIA